MLSPDGVTRRAFLLFPVWAAACGFTPAYAPRGSGSRLNGRIMLRVPDTPEGFRLRARLEDRLGRATTPNAILHVEVSTESRAALTDSDGEVVRTQLGGRASWHLASAAGMTLAEGEEIAFIGFSGTDDEGTTRVANQQARDRLMALIADRIVAELLLLSPEVLA